MTRFGVMKHLAVLEAANLVVTRKEGRTKRHFLNPVPIQQITDRWIDKYARPFTRAMVDLRPISQPDRLERIPGGKPHEPLATSYRVYIRATAEQVWQAIIDPAFTRRYFHDTAFDASPAGGAAVSHDDVERQPRRSTASSRCASRRIAWCRRGTCCTTRRWPRSRRAGWSGRSPTPATGWCGSTSCTVTSPSARSRGRT